METLSSNHPAGKSYSWKKWDPPVERTVTWKKLVGSVMTPVWRRISLGLGQLMELSVCFWTSGFQVKIVTSKRPPLWFLYWDFSSTLQEAGGRCHGSVSSFASTQIHPLLGGRGSSEAENRFEALEVVLFLEDFCLLRKKTSVLLVFLGSKARLSGICRCFHFLFAALLDVCFDSEDNFYIRGVARAERLEGRPLGRMTGKGTHLLIRGEEPGRSSVARIICSLV